MKTVRLVCGPTCGCGQTFEGVPNGSDIHCTHCGRWWGRLYNAELRLVGVFNETKSPEVQIGLPVQTFALK